MRRLSLCMILAAPAVLAGCTRLTQVGQEPDLSPIENPSRQTEQRMVSIPLPDPYPAPMPGSLFQQQGRNFFFFDERAFRVGDILTVVVNIDDEASLENQTQRSRASNEGLALTALLGLESSVLESALPSEFDPTNAVDIEGDSNTNNQGQIDREEEIDLLVAAMVTNRLPNGNLVIAGRQEVRVNYEVRELRIAGIIRPQDINVDNQILYSQIAEARIAYGGRGQLSELQQPRYGQQVLDILLPF